jgi:hypothetical protein
MTFPHGMTLRQFREYPWTARTEVKTERLGWSKVVVICFDIKLLHTSRYGRKIYIYRKEITAIREKK